MTLSIHTREHRQHPRTAPSTGEGRPTRTPTHRRRLLCRQSFPNLLGQAPDRLAQCSNRSVRLFHDPSLHSGGNRIWRQHPTQDPGSLKVLEVVALQQAPPQTSHPSRRLPLVDLQQPPHQDHTHARDLGWAVELMRRRRGRMVVAAPDNLSRSLCGRLQGSAVLTARMRKSQSSRHS